MSLQKKLNAVCWLWVAVFGLVYFVLDGTLLKGLTGAGFAAAGIINGIFARRNSDGYSSDRIAFSLYTERALLACLIGDIMLQTDFTAGALIFAFGHIMFFLSFCKYSRFSAIDAVYGSAVFAISVAILLVSPLDFGGAAMLELCVVYTLLISFAVGKAISNAFAKKTRFSAILLLGSIMFFISDAALVLYIFCGAEIANAVCFFTYFPAECILGSAVLASTPNEF